MKQAMRMKLLERGTIKGRGKYLRRMFNKTHGMTYLKAWEHRGGETAVRKVAAIMRKHEA